MYLITARDCESWCCWWWWRFFFFHCFCDISLNFTPSIMCLPIFCRISKIICFCIFFIWPKTNQYVQLHKYSMGMWVWVCVCFYLNRVMHLCVRYFSAHRSLAEAKLNMQLICIYWHVCDVDFNMKNRTQYFYMRTHHAHIIMNQKPRENTKHTKFCAETVIYISFNR